MIHQIKWPPLAGSGGKPFTPASYTARVPETTDIWTASVTFAERRAGAEHELIGAIMASVAIGVSIAESEGITQRHFQQPDLSVIFAVASLGHLPCNPPEEQAKFEILRLSRMALRRLGYWDDSQIAGNVGAMRWSDASLARLACSWPFSPHAIRHHARELIWIDCQQRLARALQRLPGDFGRERSRMSAYIPFPLRLFPSPLLEYVRQAAAALDCDPAYIAVPMLPVLASAIGNTRRIRLKQTWTEPAVVWAAIAGESGTVKSPALEMATRPVWRRQHELLKAHVVAMVEHRAEIAGWKAAPKAERGEEPEAPPACEHPLCSDITIEALADRLQATPRGTLIALDELAVWFGSFNAYKSKGGDVAHWLGLHGARALKVDRKTGDKTTIYIPHAAASITGTIQPFTLRRVLLPEFFDNGLAARLLLAMPPAKPKQWSDAEIEPELCAAVDELFAKLYGLRPDTGVDGDKAPRMVDLTHDAKAKWINFVNTHNHVGGELEGNIRAAWSKLEGYAARFALIFHCVRQASGDKQLDYIDGDDIANGVELARWFGNETQRVYRGMNETTEGRQRRELLDWIASHGGRITVRDLCRGPRRYRNDAATAESDLSALVKDALGSWESIRPGVRGGAPTTVFCLADSPDFPVAARGDGDTTDENHWETLIRHQSPSRRAVETAT